MESQNRKKATFFVRYYKSYLTMATIEAIVLWVHGFQMNCKQLQEQLHPLKLPPPLPFPSNHPQMVQNGLPEIPPKVPSIAKKLVGPPAFVHILDYCSREKISDIWSFGPINSKRSKNAECRIYMQVGCPASRRTGQGASTNAVNAEAEKNFKPMLIPFVNVCGHPRLLRHSYKIRKARPDFSYS